MQNVFDNKNVISGGCGKLISGVAMQSGSFYMWGKGEHEKSKRNDHIEFSSPKLILEQKGVVHVAFGLNHVLILDKMSALYSLGDGNKGCLGHGDTKKRFSPSLISFFTNKRVIDVSCGDSFSVVIAEVEGDPNERGTYNFNEDGLLDK